MTIKEMRKSDKPFLAPMDVCEILQCAPYSINIQIREQGADSLPFPAFMMGRNVRIPRVAFLRWCEQMGLG